ncbi:MAG: YfhO family protein, partial [Pyrinomonadaceae bacterium]
LVEESVPPAPVVAAGGEATVTRSTDTGVSVRVRAAADSFLVLSDVNYPGWRASVDGQEARVLQTNYSLRGVRVPAGDHAVEFTFAPRSSRLGALVSLCATLATALVALWLARGRRLGVDDQSS